jgi:polysaccharide export outer membrane protein
MLAMKTFTSFSLLLLLSTASAAIAQTPSSPTAPAGPVAQPNAPVAQPVGTAGSATAPAASTPATSKPATPAPATRAVPTAADYKLVPGDKLRIEVYKDPQLSQSVQVRPDGKITLPLANDVAAAGRTPAELRDAIVTALKTYMANPTVTVMVVETMPPVIYVMGEVNSAGPQPLVGQMDVLQALATAKGFKDFADTKNILIRRGTQVLRFNYNDAIKGDARPVILLPGDTVVVK